MSSITNNPAVASAVNQASVQSQQSILVLKKALDSQAQAAATLIESIPRPPSPTSLPPNLGRNVNTTA